jgi:hypothetical protein
MVQCVVTIANGLPAASRRGSSLTGEAGGLAKAVRNAGAFAELGLDHGAR